MTEPVTSMGRQPDDWRTHVECINPGDNPADGHVMVQGEVPADPGERKPYMMLIKGWHDGFLRRAGEIVHLFAHEVGPQHAPVEQPAPEAPPETAPVDPSSD